jgi:hypothetical protein
MNRAAPRRQAALDREHPVPEPRAGASPLLGSAAASRTGPWTARSWGTGADARCWVTAACTRCGALPCDEGLGMYASFENVEQAREVLPRDWGWLVAARPGGPEQVLCPGCAAPLAKETPS